MPAATVYYLTRTDFDTNSRDMPAVLSTDVDTVLI